MGLEMIVQPPGAWRANEPLPYLGVIRDTANECASALSDLAFHYPRLDDPSTANHAMTEIDWAQTELAANLGLMEAMMMILVRRWDHRTPSGRPAAAPARRIPPARQAELLGGIAASASEVMALLVDLPAPGETIDDQHAAARVILARVASAVRAIVHQHADIMDAADASPRPLGRLDRYWRTQLGVPSIGSPRSPRTRASIDSQGFRIVRRRPQRGVRRVVVEMVSAV